MRQGLELNNRSGVTSAHYNFVTGAYSLVVILLAFFAGFFLERALSVRTIHRLSLQGARRFLQADFNLDGKYERIFIDRSESQEKPSSKHLVVVEQNNRELLRLAYYDYFKEPFRNTSLAINAHGSKPRLLVKGGPNSEKAAYEFNGGGLRSVVPTAEDEKILEKMSPWM